MRSLRSNRTGTVLTVLAAATVAASALAPAASAQPTPVPISAEEFTLTILHNNNDGESKLLPDDDSGFPGVARFAAQMKMMQAAATAAGSGVITLTSGDNFLASQELGISLARDGALYDSVALSGLYDAMALGNHDFDFGPDVTARFIEGFDPAVTFLSANADFSNEPVLQALVDSGKLAASTVVDTGGQRVGVIGAVTPLLPNISSPRNAVISDVLAAVQSEAESIAAQGVNKIILVSHLQGVSEEIALVADLAGVDVVIAGGGDDLLRNEGDTCMPDDDPAGPYPLLVEDSTGTEIPVITAPGGYRCIGELAVTFDGDGNIVSHAGRSVGVSFDVAPDPAVQSSVIEPLAAAVAEVDADVIGHSEVDLDGRLAGVRTGSTNQGNLHADALRATATNLADDFGTPVPDAAIQNGGGIRNDAVIPAGEITTGDTWDIAPFRDFVVVGEVPRETFRMLLERAVDRIPGAGGQFPQVSGFTFTFEPAQPARETDWAGDCSLVGNPGSRIREVRLDDGTVIVRDGQVVPGDPVVLATNDFLANGGACYPLADIEFTKLGVSYQQALADYIAKDLGGRITAADYPAGGDDRITALAVDADVIATSDIDLDGRRASVRTGSSNQGNLHADALRATATNLAADFGTPAPDAAVQNGGGIRNDAVIPAGPITTGDTWDIAPFRNFVVVGEVPRDTFHVLLEQAVDRIPGAGGQFPQVSGFQFTYDPAAPARQTDRAGDCSLAGNAGSRIREVRLDDGTVIVRDGQVVPGDPVVLATIDFLANGGDCYPLAGIEFTKLGVSYQQALADYIAKDLGGRITAADYPAGGDDRITALAPEPEPEPEPEPQPVTVTVKRGDSLWRLARIHLGAGARWQEIYDLNRGRVQADGRTLRDPNLILIGWVLELPAS